MVDNGILVDEKYFSRENFRDSTRVSLTSLLETLKVLLILVKGTFTYVAVFR